MSNKRNKRGVSSIYTIALVWILYSAVFPPYTLTRVGIAALLSFIGYCVVRALTGDSGKTEKNREKKPEKEEKQEEAKEEKKAKYPPEVQKIVDEGARAQTELGRLYASIPELSVKRKIRDIMEISDKIIQDAVEDPQDVPQIKKFLDYYLPTTIKLLNAYDRMGAQGIEGENISGTMQKIEDMLDAAVDSYKKLLDSLFADQALDIETDIEVMNTLLKREGFGSAGSAGGMR